MDEKTKNRVLIIEDDPLLGPSLKEFLESKGFFVDWIPSGKTLDLSQVADYNLVILDLILPDVPGEELLTRIKNQIPHIGILVLTAKGAIEDKKECFERGADDYLTKPFDTTELYLRIKALLRRSQRHSKPRHTIGEITVDIGRRTIYKGKREINLSRRGWDLLCYLLERRGTIVTKKEILEKVWRDTLVTEDSVRSYIKELRKILPQGAITTFKGRGYRLN